MGSKRINVFSCTIDYFHQNNIIWSIFFSKTAIFRPRKKMLQFLYISFLFYLCIPNSFIQLLRIIQMINSSPKNSHQYFSNDTHDHFTNKYLSNQNTSNYYSNEIRKEHIESQIESINHSLMILFPNKPTLGDLFSNDINQIERTIEVIKLLLNQRQKDMETKNQIFGNTRKIEGEKSYLQIQIQKMQKEAKRLQSQKDSLNLRIKTLEKQMKQMQTQFNRQSEQLVKKYKAIEMRQNQYKNQFRKQQTTIKNLQDKISKNQQKVPFKNNMQVMQELQKYGPTFIMMNSENQYNQMVAKTMQQNYNDIVRQNEYYKGCFQQIQRQLKSVLDIKKQILKKRKVYDYDEQFEIKPIKPEKFNLPFEYGKEGMKVLQENVQKFKQAMRVGQALDDKEANQKVNCVNNVKNLIKNYKNVVESQQTLLNKVLIKAKQFKTNEIQAIQSKFNKSFDDDQLSRARRFLQEQSSYLDNKNRQLEVTKKAMQTTLRKVEQQKQEFSKRNTKNNQDLLSIKRNIEALPILIEKEMNK